jgi:hypothetical protein
MQHSWFKPKRFGLGAYPASWQGWALTAGYVLLLVALSGWLTTDTANAEHRLTPFFFITVAVTIVFVAICWRTTEGGWRWRWGDDK